MNFWKEWRIPILFIAFVIIPVKSSLADWNVVPTGSMNPTIVEGDIVFVNKLAYDVRVPLTLHRIKHLSDPSRGDISVLLSPDDRTRLVKRVIGLPGDEIEMRNNRLLINGEPIDYLPLAAKETDDLSESLRQESDFANEQLPGRPHAVMSQPARPVPFRSFSKIIVPEDHYFVMGDNRDNSKDSRSFGFVERRLFLGEASHVVVSFNRLDKLQPRFGRFFTPMD